MWLLRVDLMRHSAEAGRLAASEPAEHVNVTPAGFREESLEKIRRIDLVVTVDEGNTPGSVKNAPRLRGPRPIAFDRPDTLGDDADHLCARHFKLDAFIREVSRGITMLQVQ